MPYSLPPFPYTARARRSFLAADQFSETKFSADIAKLFEYLKSVEIPSVEIPRNAWQIWFYSLTHCRRSLIASAKWSLFAALATLAAVIVNQRLIESLGDLKLCLFLAFCFLIAELASNVCRFFELRTRVQTGLGLEAVLTALVNHKLKTLDRNLSTELSSGNIKTLIRSDIDNITDLFFAVAATCVPALFLLVVLTPVLYLMMGVAALVGIGIALAQVPFSMLCGYFIERFQIKQQLELDRLTTKLGEWLKNVRLMRYLGWQEALKRDAALTQRNYNIRTIPRHTIECAVYGFSTGWWMFPLLGILFYSYSSAEVLSVSHIFAAVWALNYLSNYIQHLPFAITRYGTASAGVYRITQLLSLPDLSRGFKSAPLHQKPVGQPVCLELENLKVSYAGRVVLQISKLKIDLLKRTAVVGEVGSGKSTLLKVLAGECVPTSGEIFIFDQGGAKFNLWNPEVYSWWRSNIAFSQQESFLSNATVQANITLGDDELSAAAKDAASAAELIQDIELFEHGFSEEVGETGINLSGGQKSRVALARAFYSGRTVFLLDDPLSAVDHSTEKRLMEQICVRSSGFILVSHRFLELSRCDRVIVLERGSVIEDGKPNDLAADSRSNFWRFLNRTKPDGAANG